MDVGEILSMAPHRAHTEQLLDHAEQKLLSNSPMQQHDGSVLSGPTGGCGTGSSVIIAITTTRDQWTR